MELVIPTPVEVEAIAALLHILPLAGHRESLAWTPRHPEGITRDRPRQTVGEGIRPQLAETVTNDSTQRGGDPRPAFVGIGVSPPLR